MFVQISPSEHDLGETVSSLNFASRVRGIELAPARRQVDTSELQKTKMLVISSIFFFLLLFTNYYLPIRETFGSGLIIMPLTLTMFFSLIKQGKNQNAKMNQ